MSNRNWKLLIVAAFWALVCYVVACFLIGVSCTGVSVQQSCDAALAQLRAEKDAGVLSCEQAKTKVLLQYPTCPLDFHCRAKDGGQ